MLIELLGVLDPSFVAAATLWNSHLSFDNKPIEVRVSMAQLHQFTNAETYIDEIKKGKNRIWLPTKARIIVNERKWKIYNDFPSLKLQIAVHELGHALGFAEVVFEKNGLSRRGKYIGLNALKTYKREYMEDADFIFVSGSHWQESTEKKDVQGRYVREEVMTPETSGTWYLSATTLGVFKDLGYRVSAPSVPKIKNRKVFFDRGILQKSGDLKSWRDTIEYDIMGSFAYFRVSY